MEDDGEDRERRRWEKKEKKERKRERKERDQREADDAVAAAALEEDVEREEALAREGLVSNKKGRREREGGADESVLRTLPTVAENQYPPKPPEQLDTTILLFYAYCDPPMTRTMQDEMISKCQQTLVKHGVTGRLRVGREGFNATLTGPTEGTRKFTDFLRKTDPATFAHTDFKYVDQQSRNKRLKELKVWPVTEIVTYGFDPAEAPLHMRGTHLKPREFHQAMEDPNAIMIDVRNFNESLIGKFAPPERVVLDPQMRRSTEFPEWVEKHKKVLEGKKVLMYCTAGVRCERASAFMRNKGVQNVFQLEGGIHRYLDEFPQDGGYWLGKNYTFDKRFSHAAEVSDVISSCVMCKEPWDRYQAQLTCCKCQMEVLVCKTCQKTKPKKNTLSCPLCDSHSKN